MLSVDQRFERPSLLLKIKNRAVDATKVTISEGSIELFLYYCNRLDDDVSVGSTNRRAGIRLQVSSRRSAGSSTTRRQPFPQRFHKTIATTPSILDLYCRYYRSVLPLAPVPFSPPFLSFTPLISASLSTPLCTPESVPPPAAFFFPCLND